MFTTITVNNRPIQFWVQYVWVNHQLVPVKPASWDEMDEDWAAPSEETMDAWYEAMESDGIHTTEELDEEFSQWWSQQKYPGYCYLEDEDEWIFAEGAEFAN